jgi:hypothetical protein
MKVFYQRSYSIAPYLTERIGFEVEVDLDYAGEPQPIIDQVSVIKELCDKTHKELNPGLNLTNDYSSIPTHPMSTISQKDLEQKLILMAELEAAKTTEEVTTIYNEAPAAVKSDQEFFQAVINAKQRIKK